MIAGGTPTKPGLGVGDVRVRTLLVSNAVDHHRRFGGHVQGSLRNNGRLVGCENAAAPASLRVLAYLGRKRIGVRSGIGVVGLAADIADRKYQVSSELAIHGKVPYLDSRGGDVRIETRGLINRAGRRDARAARDRKSTRLNSS